MAPRKKQTRKTSEELALIKHFEKFNEMLALLGVETAHNAVEKLKGMHNREGMYEAHVNEFLTILGVTSIGNGKQRVRALVKKDDLTIQNSGLPETFFAVPRLWLEGRYETKKKAAIAPMKPTVAQRRHRCITPLLIEAWQLAEGDEQIQAEIEREYLTTSADEFEKNLYIYIHDLEPVDLHDELIDYEPHIGEIESVLSYKLDADMKYNVQKTIEDEDN